jgi:hypothetical protein
MSNTIKNAMGRAPNSEFVIDPQGKIVRKRFWSNPNTLRKDLEELVGPVENPTRVADLPARFRVEPRKIASGVVPRLAMPRGLAPLKIKPIGAEKTAFYVKLRAEASRQLLRRGEGKLFLGFYLDPLYKVHWNNRARRVQVEINAADGVEVTPSTLQGPEVKEDADVDPRQFMVEVKRGDIKSPLELTVKYMACDDAETFCVPVTQHYLVHFEPDRNGGSRPGVFMPAMFAKVREFDKNKDGKITKDELPPGRSTLYMGHIDFNNDQVIDRHEVDEFLKMFNNGLGFESSKNFGEQDAKPETTPERKDDSTKQESKT